MAASCSIVTFTDEQRASAPDMEPAFENLLRNLSVDESIITALQVNMIADRETFVGLVDTEAGFMKNAPDFGIDLENGGVAHKREMSRLITAWKHARVAAETKLQADAAAKVHCVPTSMLPEDWTSLLTAFQKQILKTHSGREATVPIVLRILRRQTRGRCPQSRALKYGGHHVRKNIPRANKPDPIRQHGLSLDSKLTVTTKKRHVRSEPTDEKSLRDKYAIMMYMWLPAQMKQPGRSIYKDFDQKTLWTS